MIVVINVLIIDDNSDKIKMIMVRENFVHALIIIYVYTFIQ